MLYSDVRGLFFILYNVAIVASQGYPVLDADCDKLYPKLWIQYAPRGNASAGLYVKYPNINSVNLCLESCCSSHKCNVMFMHGKDCFHIKCFSNEECIPMYRTDLRNISMMLVAPLPPQTNWAEVLPDEMIISDFSPREEDDMIMSAEPNYYLSRDKECELGIELNCGKYEECVPQSTAGNRRRSGVCECLEGYVRNEVGYCERRDISSKYDATPSSPSQPIRPVNADSDATSNKSLKPLLVSVVSKTVQLPEDEVTLSAYVVPPGGENYVFNWILISQPKGGNSGTMTDKNGDSLKLSHLVEGVYQFNVTVSAPGAYGETNATVTVLPPRRINKLPVAIITPKYQTVKLPKNVTVLDGSTSYDDDGIISWHWDLEKGPLGYQPILDDSSTLQLKDLKIPGNYTFKLTVEDTDHKTNFTTANITVVKVMDYPPEAYAGQDVIVFLPVNNVTLNGNMSTDDKGIVSWEWTKSPSNQDKAVDMQKTRTPYLELSNLEEGMYTFVLKVTDSSGQFSTSDVRVFVKPPTNKPPIANAGEDVVVSLPRTWVTLDASRSSDDIKIASYHWKQISGPSKVVFTPSNASKTNASELTRGVYELQVTVVDSDGNATSDSVLVTVNQNENAPPKANAGGDQTIVLPVSVVVLNGSGSSDDLAIKKWEWIRDGSSLTLGRVISDSDKTPILMLTDLIPGRYVFRLKVTDGQGLSDEDTVSIIVKPDPYLLHLVELTLNIEGSSLTVAQEQSLEANLALLLRDATIHVRELRREQNTGRAVLVFYVGQHDDKTILSGPQVVKILKEKLKRDSGLLEVSVANIQTAVCQNNCSGHGSCDQSTRLCLCEAFWMQNLIRKHFGDGDSNCDWSILYVIIVLFVGILVVAGCSWGVTCLIQRACRRPRKRQRFYAYSQRGRLGC
ncbi:UNVERIFIED_CONTAM: hypothetical protein PYX00_002996 [Menopon gallinae]|uniref:Dyslexia-associated protein KIAA0319-like protein n=1 Tax=Menopon gallinae TaxID=328185 RepID=A0AAW2HZM7_9NEOP